MRSVVICHGIEFSPHGARDYVGVIAGQNCKVWHHTRGLYRWRVTKNVPGKPATFGQGQTMAEAVANAMNNFPRRPLSEQTAQATNADLDFRLIQKADQVAQVLREEAQQSVPGSDEDAYYADLNRGFAADRI